MVPWDFPPSATSLHSPMRRGRWAARRRSPWELFLTCRIRLPRRNMGSRGRVRAAEGLRHPRGLGGAAEAHEPGEEMGAKLLKRREGFVGEERLCVHAAKHRVVHLTDGSDETASTPKIVSDARDLQFDLKMRSAPWRARQPSKEKPREAAFPKR
jgi:hypothetical protein